MRGLDECVAFFRNDSGFAGLMDGLFDIYLRYERCFGGVRLVNPSEEEEHAISEFFKRDYYDQALIRIGLAEFERRAQQVFSPELTLSAILESYFRRPLFLRKPEVRAQSSAFVSFLDQTLTPRYLGTDAEPWLKDLTQNTRRTYREWAQDFNNNAAEVSAAIESVCESLNNLPLFSGTRERLRDFTAKFVADPHAFDYSGSMGSYFMRALAKTFDTLVPNSPEEFSSLCHRAGLLTEGVLNTVTLRGIGFASEGTDDAACAVYNARREPHVLTLENINGFDTAYGGGKVYIIENTGVFSAVNERVRGIDCRIICADAGLGAAFTFVLDMLVNAGTKLYYSGSMDYRGMQLADKVYLRYSKAFVPWRYDKSDYDSAVSSSDFFLPESKRDIGLHSEELASLLSYMKKKGKSVPQSALMSYLVEDIMKENQQIRQFPI